MDRLALNLVTYNEEHRIEQTLRHIWPYVDEVVIVDQQSTDRTAEICRDLGARVTIDRHWGYCEASRTLALSRTEADWILVLDADERLSQTMLATLREVDQRGWRGARLKRSLWLGGVHHFTGDRQYRLFRRDAVRFLNELHTEPQPTVDESLVWSPDFVGIWHEKSWQEQIRDEVAYDELLQHPQTNRQAKRDLNWKLTRLRELGLDAADLDRLTPPERHALGFGPAGPPSQESPH